MYIKNIFLHGFVSDTTKEEFEKLLKQWIEGLSTSCVALGTCKDSRIYAKLNFQQLKPILDSISPDLIMLIKNILFIFNKNTSKYK